MNFILFITITFAIFALTRVILRSRDKTVSKKETVFWLLIWSAIILIAANPRSIVFFNTILGGEWGTQYIVYLSIILLFYLIFRLYVKVETRRQEVTKLVREIAIIKSDKKNEK